MSVKRRRVGANVVRAARRPISKTLIVVKDDAVDGTQAKTLLFTTTFPATMVGLRWSLSALQGLGTTAVTQLQWAIVISRDGNVANTMSTGDSNSLYSPEADVLAFGCANMKTHTAASTVMPITWNGDTKTMRKLKTGDVLEIIYVAEATNTWAFFGCVQFFVKA